MISRLYPLRKKLLEVTKQCNNWKLHKLEVKDYNKRLSIALIISLLEDYKADLRKEIEELENEEKPC